MKVKKLISVLLAAGMIAMSIIVMDGLFRLLFKKKGETYVDCR